jgi:hypothetical protein
MKKILAFIILSVALVSCYEEYIKDYPYSAVYFTNQIDVRTVVVGEGMKIRFGVGLGGVMENKIDRNVGFTLKNDLITSQVLADMKASSQTYIKDAVSGISSLSALPSNYYTLSNTNTFVIKSGWHSGSITLKVDSAAFLADPATLKAAYVLPVYISTADADTILEPKRSTVIGLKYENMLFGNYFHGGVTTVKDASGATKQTITYPTAINQELAKSWNLATVGPNVLATNAYSDKSASATKKELLLTLNGTNITVSSATGSTNTYEANGACTYNAAKLLQNRKIVLNYKYVIGTDTYYCQDTLTFRNRIRDGVNEWQDENPSHY